MSFFVPGSLIPEEDESFPQVVEFRARAWRDIVKKQLDLAYYAHIGVSETDTMAPSEREAFYSLLVEMKEKENQQIEEELGRNSRRSVTGEV